MVAIRYLPSQQSENKNKVKTKTKQQATSNKATSNKVNWDSLLPTLNALTHGMNTLYDQLKALWDASDYTDPLKFRADFVEWYVSLKTENPEGARAYAMRIACDAGFRVRAKGAGRKAGKASNKPSKPSDKPSKFKPTKADQLDLSAMPKAELAKVLANAAALL
jgi:hypothetical protein